LILTQQPTNTWNWIIIQKKRLAKLWNELKDIYDAHKVADDIATVTDYEAVSEQQLLLWDMIVLI